MSLARLALRIATCEALRPTDALPNGPFPTSAAALVFDSLEAPINDLAEGERKPVVIVFTDESNGDPGQKAGGPPFDCTVDIVFRISVAQGGKEESGAYFVGTPATDPEAEASLDVLEAQIMFALCYGVTGKMWRTITGRKIVDISSLPHRTSEEGVRLAERTFRMKVRVQDDVFDPAPLVAPTGLDRLPDPLKSMLAMLSASSYGTALAAGIAAAAPVMPTAAPLEGVTLDIQPGSPPGAVDESKPRIGASVDDLNA